MIPLVVASERGRAQTMHVARHVWGSKAARSHVRGEQNGLESPAAAGASPLRELLYVCSVILSSAGHEESCMNPAGPSAKAKYSQETDSEPVP